MGTSGHLSDLAMPSLRDIFLSHRSVDKEFVRKLAGDIEAEAFQGRRLLTWVDEAEIRPGQSIPGMIEQGLERSRFIGLVMTPAYFRSESGWTDAEWHSALHTDPDNRKARIIPLLVYDCPYIPFLLRHLKAIDFRSNRYAQAFEELLRILRDEPLPRPITYRGQLVAPGGRIDRSSLIAERAVPQADPDVLSERLYCNLLPVERLPQYVYSAPISYQLRKPRKDALTLPSKEEIKNAIRAAQQEGGVERPFMPTFRVIQDRIVSFHDLDSADGPLAAVVEDEDVEVVPTTELLRDEDERRVVISLLNMAIARHANRVGLVIDDTKQGRFFFPSKDGGPNVITWISKKNKAPRTVAKPCVKDGQVLFWRHLAAYIRMLFLPNRFYLRIVPTWVITADGFSPKGGPNVGRLIIKWTGPERNLQVLYHIRFWTTMLRTGPGPISVRAGDQRIEIATVPAFVQQSYGVAHDQRDLMGLLDREAPLIAEREDMIADLAAEEELTRLADVVDDEVLTDEENGKTEGDGE